MTAPRMSSLRTTFSRMSLTSTTSLPRCKSACAPGRPDDRGRAPRPPRRAEPVRHDLPRALHVLHAADRGTGPRPPWTARLRRRGARHAQARFGSSSSTMTTRVRRSPRSRAAGPGACRRVRHARGARGLRVARRVNEARPPRLPDRGEAARIQDRRLRRAGQGQHAPHVLRNRERFPRLPRRSQPAQARSVHAGHAHPYPSTRATCRDQARRHRHPAVEPPERDRRPVVLRSQGLGRGWSCRSPSRGD